MSVLNLIDLSVGMKITIFKQNQCKTFYQIVHLFMWLSMIDEMCGTTLLLGSILEITYIFWGNQKTPQNKKSVIFSMNKKLLLSRINFMKLTTVCDKITLKRKKCRCSLVKKLIIFWHLQQELSKRYITVTLIHTIKLNQSHPK